MPDKKGNPLKHEPGWVRRKPFARRVYRGGRTWTRKPVLQRLLSRISYEHGCWRWGGYCDHKGYGKALGTEGRAVRLVHRLMYELLVGPIPAGLFLDHLCRFTSCCNPLHLEPVTNLENLMRGNPGAHMKRVMAARLAKEDDVALPITQR